MPVQELTFPAATGGALAGRALSAADVFVLDDDTKLRIVSANSLAGVVIGVRGLRLDENGVARVINETHTPNTDRSTKTQDYGIGKGALLRLALFVTGAAPVLGQTYVIAQLIRGITGQTVVIGVLVGGSITAVQPIGFPGSGIRNSLEGPGWTSSVALANPGNNLDLDSAVPAGARWELRGVFATVSTDAGGGVNNPYALMRDAAGNALARSMIAQVIAASSVVQLCWSPGLDSAGYQIAGQFVDGPLPYPVTLLAGQRVHVGFASVGGGVWALTGCRLQVVEHLEVN